MSGGESIVGPELCAADHVIADIAEQFDFLLGMTPCNQTDAWQEFCAAGGRVAPAFQYRSLMIEPSAARRRLEDVSLEHVESTLCKLLADKRSELLLQIALLESRGTPEALAHSLKMYGSVDDALLAEAERILAAVPMTERPVDSRVRADAMTVELRAREELAYYRETYPDLVADVCVRGDITALTVSHGTLMVPGAIEVDEHRIAALLQHEVGTHIVTYVNGSAQPLRVLSIGLAGYEALQEGLAVVAEHIAGGFDVNRLRVLAARVIACRRIAEGATFPALVAELVETHRFTQKTAFGIAVRVFRGGGLTKDAIYLRGLRDVLAYLHAGHDLAPLLVGKVAFEHAHIIAALLESHILRAPVLMPRWLSDEVHAKRLARVRKGVHPLDLVGAS
ncbi:MAG TPA: tyrosine/phenylalanine carboxypeptidase domain-containing protein [Kofleriaceae bacterium]